MSLADGDVFAGYTVVRLLGSEEMGEVYLVKHPRLPRLDALKVLPVAISANPEFRSRFEREVDVLATMRHPHIVGVHDRGDDDGHLWITMDFVEGYDAALLLREQWPDGMPVDEVVTIVSAVADALDYAHDRQLLHGDVKPAKILLTDDAGPKRRVRLTGFGIARHTDDGVGLTAANMTVADVNYAAPEQLLDEDVDGRADQYALAATTYHLLTGSAPFPHTNPTVIISRHLNTPPPALASTHPQLAALDPVLGRALAKNREDRYPAAREYADALIDALRGTAASGNDWSSPPRTAGAGSFTPEPAPTSPVDTPAADPAALAAEAPPVYVSDWGATQHKVNKEPRAAEPRLATPSPPPPPTPLPPPTPSRVGPPPVLIGVAVGIAIVLIAMITYVVLNAAAGDSSTSAPQESSQSPRRTTPTSIAGAEATGSTNTPTTSASAGPATSPPSESSPHPGASGVKPDGSALTIVDYINENDITETPVQRGDPGAPNIKLPIPPGWEDAGARTPDWAYGAIMYTGDPEMWQDPATIIAILSKLTGDVDPARILDLAAGEIQNLPGFEGPETGKPSTLSGFDATQIGGLYIRDGMDRMIAQKTVVIPGDDGLYVLQLNADGTEDQAGPLMDATQSIDDDTTITP